MQGSDSTLLRLMDGAGRRFIIPVYQRYYDWKKENCKQLFDDLVRLVREGKKSHFFGSIVSYSFSKNDIVIIDGQQRLTTVSLILIAIINAIKEGLCTPNNPNLALVIEECYIIDKFRNEERKIRLKPFRDDCKAFDKLIEGNKKEYIIDSKVTINYNYFYDRITQNKELTVDELFAAIENLSIIDIELQPDKGDDPQLIFESLNSTGLDLTESDKIRNFILMGLSPDKQESYYDSYWKNIESCCGTELDFFVRNFLTIATGEIPALKRIYPVFKEYARSVNNVEFLLNEMLKYAEAYQKITTFDIGSTKGNEIAKRVNLLEVTVAHPFLMAFLVYAEEKQIPITEIENVFSCTEVYIFRRLMCDLPTGALNKIFAQLHKVILKNLSDSASYSSVMIYILESKKQSSTFPKDTEFIQGFTTKNIYSLKAKNKEYIFDRLENMSSKEKNDIIKNIEDNTLTIEHIMPQTLNPTWQKALGENYLDIHEKWLHTISNLTLTGYNSSYSNHSFEDKKNMKDGFAESGLRLNHYIAHFDKWTEIELNERKNKLVQMALEIWEYPKTNFIPSKVEDEVIYLSEDNDVPVGRKLSNFVFQGTRTNVHDWIDVMRHMIKNLYNIDPTILYKEAANPNNGWFSNKPKDKFEKIDEGLYFCTSFHGTSVKMGILKNLFHKYQIEEDDLYFVVLPAKDNSVQEPREAYFPKKSDIAVPEEITNWIVPSNVKNFKIQEWWDKHDYIYWVQSVNFHVGDLVYLYLSNPIKAVRYLCKVEEIDIVNYDFAEERSYWLNNNFYLSKDKPHVKLRLLQTSQDSSSLSLKQLLENGLNGAPQKGCRLKDNLLHYIQSYF